MPESAANNRRGEALMDIEMDFECRECGWVFTRSFLLLEHGRILKCPFCSGTRLGVRHEAVIEEGIAESPAERLPGEDHYVELKIKL